jgi:hypothetical protein
LQSSVALAVSERPTHRFQHTLQALIDFTGYLTTKTYALASAIHRLPGTVQSSTTPIEEEVRTEIKALKGLVLNRYVFTVFLEGKWPLDPYYRRRTFIPPTIPRPFNVAMDKS